MFGRAVIDPSRQPFDVPSLRVKANHAVGVDAAQVRRHERIGADLRVGVWHAQFFKSRLDKPHKPLMVDPLARFHIRSHAEFSLFSAGALSDTEIIVIDFHVAVIAPFGWDHVKIAAFHQLIDFARLAFDTAA